MTIFSTYCSAEKEVADGLLPAIERYRSERIKRIYSAALVCGVGFFILSGEFGLLSPNEPIPYYDHLLTGNEVESHSGKIAGQIKQCGITQIIFFTLPVAMDDTLAAYHACLRLACQIASINLSFVEIDFA
ncbi:MAG: hypothetical protein JST85_15480 [Acidobacteria bacterium]|nr:hypothetical protein [Acidobacteriota bacterium]